MAFMRVDTLETDLSVEASAQRRGFKLDNPATQFGVGGAWAGPRPAGFLELWSRQQTATRVQVVLRVDDSTDLYDETAAVLLFYRQHGTTTWHEVSLNVVSLNNEIRTFQSENAFNTTVFEPGEIWEIRARRSGAAFDFDFHNNDTVAVIQDSISLESALSKIHRDMIGRVAAAAGTGGTTYTAGSGMTLTSDEFSVDYPVPITGGQVARVLEWLGPGIGDFGWGELPVESLDVEGGIEAAIVSNNQYTLSLSDPLPIAKFPVVTVAKGGTGSSSAANARIALGTNVADNINSGTLHNNRLPTVNIAHGGTGSTSAVNARQALGTNNADNLLSGTVHNNRLPTVNVAHGGTGVTNSTAARISLGTDNAANITFGELSQFRLPRVPINKGGTNATTVDDARDNLGLGTCGNAGRMARAAGEIPEIEQ